MLLGNSHTLTNAHRVRLRLARGRDHRAVLDLAARAGSPLGELEAQRLVRPRPDAQVAVCAVMWDAGREALVGFATASLQDGEPDVLLCDGARAPGLEDLLGRAVTERARVVRRSAA